ncbi:MAG: hypothetical protein IPP66_13010 [Anaerolineales bacterium]|nr:hypothetical protein [Anaerolineales bacterium]
MKQKVIYVLLASILILTACGGSDADATPTLSPEQIQTQAVETFSAVLTQTALAAPTQTPFSTPTTQPTFAPVATSAAITLPANTQVVVPPTASCYQLRFVSDVSIPDNTPMTPGQTFTKTWKVKNLGSCAWDAGFKFAFTGGEAMNGATYTLPSSVASGAELDISVALTAPTNKTGAIRSNWRMSTAGGQFFGDEVYVLITVGGATATATKAKTPTATTQPAYP